MFTTGLQGLEDEISFALESICCEQYYCALMAVKGIRQYVP